jgi:hypothetical protein
MAYGFVPGFRPSTCGFHFANVFTAQPILTLSVPGIGDVPVGDASRGLCGGMVFAARDLFEAHQSPPPNSEPPPSGSPLFRYLVRRLFDSFNLPRGPLRYFQWMNLTETAVQRRTATREWPRIRAELDRGVLTPVGLVKVQSFNPLVMGENHQVLAYGYEGDAATGAVRIWVYDPNYPDDDEVTLFVNVGESPPTPVTYSTGSRVRGFFLTRYRGTPSLAKMGRK